MLSSDPPRRPLRPSYSALSATRTAYPAHPSTAPCRKGSDPFHQQQDEAGGGSQPAGTGAGVLEVLQGQEPGSAAGGWVLGWRGASLRWQHGACRTPARAVPDQRPCPWSRERRSWPPPAPWGARDAPRGLQEAGGEQRGAAVASRASPKEGSEGRRPRSRGSSRKPSFCGNCCRLLRAAFKQLFLQPRGLRLMEAD